jgi:hypothetical protein
MKIILPLILILSLACASTPRTQASGDSSASLKAGDITTTTVTAPDGTVTVIEVCHQCEVDESVGGQGSERLYGMLADVLLGFVSIASLLLQAL